MARHDYIFVDESGDAAFTHDPVSRQLSSSRLYIAAALHLCDDSFRDLNKHMAAFRYYSGLSRELKIPAGREEFTRLLDPIRAMAEGGKNIWASVVYVDKLSYTGSYLKLGGKRPPSPVRFRNYILRRLLEHHFRRYQLRAKQYDLVLDRIELTREETENLRHYISGNRNIPTPTHITEGYKSVVDGEHPPSELSFVNPRDLTTNQSVHKKSVG